MVAEIQKKYDRNIRKNDPNFYLESATKLMTFFNNTLKNRNPSIDLIMSSPTGCMLIVEVMKNYYLNTDLTKQNLVKKTVDGISLNMNQSSVYKLLDRSIEQNIFVSVLKENDKRVRLILPSDKTVSDMEKWFDEIEIV
tara:strand:- start:693 stop:1109 length:417 start_codon:yes stop_codon:yes gene_type:complete